MYGDLRESKRLITQAYRRLNEEEIEMGMERNLQGFRKFVNAKKRVMAVSLSCPQEHPNGEY